MAKSRAADSFKPSKRIQPAGSVLKLSGELPGEGSRKGVQLSIPVTATDGRRERDIRLTQKLAEGGEGTVYKTNVKGYVAKIYFLDRLTSDRREKLKIMISKPVSCRGVCFPEALVLNSQNEFVGYLMREAKGHELGKSVFQPKLLLQKFPKWNKRDLIDLSLTILEKIKYLNDRNVIMGDINPANILVVSPEEVYFVDCDSYQVAGYPCPVGTANYTAPEVQGRDYKTFLRSQEMENFAIATLLFMIMLPGKPPYSAVGGASPEQNIAEGVFPYPHKETETDRTPPGKWGYIWSHMSYKMRLAFYENFKKGEDHFAPQARYSVDQWIAAFRDYRYAIDRMVQNDPMALEVFPSREKMKECKECHRMYVPNRDSYTPYCPACDSKHNWPRRNIPELSRQGANSVSDGKCCPYCGSVRIPSHWRYCNGCKDKVVAQRECVNCHKSFPVTVSLDAWEKSRGAKRRQCDVCREAGCTEDPCRHATAVSRATSGTSEIQQSKALGQSGSEGCYIATAVYGSYDHPQTILLRRYRDEVLAKRVTGRLFVRLYYCISPHLVKMLGSHDAFNRFWRKRLDAMVESIRAKYGLDI